VDLQYCQCQYWNGKYGLVRLGAESSLAATSSVARSFSGPCFESYLFCVRRVFRQIYRSTCVLTIRPRPVQVDKSSDAFDKAPSALRRSGRVGDKFVGLRARHVVRCVFRARLPQVTIVSKMLRLFQGFRIVTLTYSVEDPTREMYSLSCNRTRAPPILPGRGANIRLHRAASKVGSQNG
jgi:hypothetical protein